MLSISVKEFLEHTYLDQISMRECEWNRAEVAERVSCREQHDLSVLVSSSARPNFHANVVVSEGENYYGK